MSITYAYAGDIVKTENSDGDLIVYGKATGPDLDLDEQICDPTWLKEAMPAWFKFGNVREMHQPIAAGVGVELNGEGDDWFLKSQVVDDNTARKIEAGALKGYSIGIKGAKVIKDTVAKGGRIIGGTIVEVSYVDRPCNPTAVANIAKAIGTEDLEAVEAPAISELEAAELASYRVHKSSTIVQDASSAAPSEISSDGSPGTEGIIPGDWTPEQGYEANPEEYPGDHQCSVCDGLGKLPETGQTCPHCDGTGLVDNAPAEAGTPTAEIHDRKKPQLSNSQMTQAEIDAHISGTKDADADVAKKDYSDAERANMADAGQAMEGGGFPIKTVADLKNAIQSIGRAKNRAETIAHIKSRAATLGREDLIPDQWKDLEADLGKVEHNAADLEAVRTSLIALIKAELDEMMSGEEDEVCDVRDLMTALQIFLNWWEGEAAEGETDSPFTTDSDDAGQTIGDDSMAYMALGVDADLIKRASEDDDAKEELRAEIRKVLNLEETVTEIAKAAQKEQFDLLEAELAGIKEMAAPGGPAITRTHSQTSKALDAERMQAEAGRFRHIAGQVTDPTLKADYFAKAESLAKSAAEIISA